MRAPFMFALKRPFLKADLAPESYQEQVRKSFPSPRNISTTARRSWVTSGLAVLVAIKRSPHSGTFYITARTYSGHGAAARHRFAK